MHLGQRELILQINRELEVEQYEERAAIIQEAVGCPRGEAERLARESVRLRPLTAWPPGRTAVGGAP